MKETKKNIYKCECCNREFGEEEFELTGNENKCVLHLEKEIEQNENNNEIYNTAFNEYVSLNLKYGNSIKFFDIIFLPCFEESKYRNLEEMNFLYCRFYKNLYFDYSTKVFYEYCHFYVYWNNIRAENFSNHKKHRYLFDNCIFYKKLENTFPDDGITIYTSKLFNNCTFKNNINFQNGIFNEKIFKDCMFENQKELVIKNSDIKKRFEINKRGLLKFNLLNFENSIFFEKVKIKCCELICTNFSNTKFEDLADFYKTTFFNTNFNKTDFNDISVFTEAIFEKNVNFEYTTFNKLSIFRKTVLKKELDLTDSIFNVKANFLGISSDKNNYQDIKVSNRETARIIKDSFEQQNNIIEANKFYTLEMKEREKELEFNKEPFEWLVFKIHGLSSNHSQDWLLSLFWIVYFTFAIVLLDYNTNINTFIPVLSGFILGIVTASHSDNMGKSILLFLLSIFNYGIYSEITKDFCLHEFTNKLNPFSIMNGWDDLNFSNFIYKIVIAYLIYQLIISIRQNTRRK